jgi:tRNA-dihydrouridine synthase B
MALKLGNLTLQSKFLLSPMEEVSDVGFRHLCYANGAGITWTEMIRAKGIVRHNKATLDLIDTHDPKTLTGIQLSVVNERELLDGLIAIEELAKSTHPHFLNIRAVDLNFGCPSPEVIMVGAGPALLKRTQKMGAIFKTLHDWKSQTSMDIGAVGVKIRLGLNELEQEHKVYLRFMDEANANLDYMIVHARNAKQRSRDLPTWSGIKEVKEKATIPIIGNGNVLLKADADRMFKETGCDAIMLARAAIQSPWIFRELSGKASRIPTRQEIDDAQKMYLDFARRFHTKFKYQEFHKNNFERLRKGAPATIPQTAHL